MHSVSGLMLLGDCGEDEHWCVFCALDGVLPSDVDDSSVAAAQKQHALVMERRNQISADQRRRQTERRNQAGAEDQRQKAVAQATRNQQKRAYRAATELRRKKKRAAVATRSKISLKAEAKARRLAREAAAPGFATPEQLAARWAYYGGRCWMCRRPAVLMDHVKPLICGGSQWPANQRPACFPCNGRKGRRWPFPAKHTLNGG